MTGTEGYESEGIRGLRALGVRELSYKLVFLACYVAPTNPRVSLQRKEIERCWLVSALYGFPSDQGGGMGKGLSVCVCHLSVLV